MLSSTINKYMYLTVHPYWHSGKYHIRYSKTELVDSVDAIQHTIVREALRRIPAKGIVVTSDADVPAGTGLGSSSSYAVGLLHALHAWSGKFVSRTRLAEEACEIEIDALKKPIGKQDQYAAAFGGMNVIEFAQDHSVSVHRLPISTRTRDELNKNLMMFYTGDQRDANTILAEQSQNMLSPQKIEQTKNMVELVWELRDAIISGDLSTMGTLLHKNWTIKKQLGSKITDTLIDGYYDKAMMAGALGGKLLGAGGRGFLLFYVEPQKQDAVRNALGLKQLAFRFDTGGSQIIYTGDEGENDAIGLSD